MKPNKYINQLLSKNKRKKQRYINTYHWKKHIHTSVVCPNCSKEAIVDNDIYFYSSGVEVRCNHCGFNKKSEDILFYKAIIELNCPNCGKKIYHNQGKIKKKFLHLSVQCSFCEENFDIKPKYESYKEIFPSEKGLICDNFFGLPYFFQTNIKGNLFWVKNKEHLLEIKRYISADLRERIGMIMVAKLPTFIKLAKNKTKILKTLEKWEKMI